MMNKRIQHYVVYYSNVAFPPIPKLGFLSLDKAEDMYMNRTQKFLAGTNGKIGITSTRLVPKRNSGGILGKNIGK